MESFNNLRAAVDIKDETDDSSVSVDFTGIDGAGIDGEIQEGEYSQADTRKASGKRSHKASPEAA